MVNFVSGVTSDEKQSYNKQNMNYINSIEQLIYFRIDMKIK